MASYSVAAMGTGKKERNRLTRQGKSGSGMDNIKIKGENFYRYVMPGSLPIAIRLRLPATAQSMRSLC